MDTTVPGPGTCQRHLATNVKFSDHSELARKQDENNVKITRVDLQARERTHTGPVSIDLRSHFAS